MLIKRPSRLVFAARVLLGSEIPALARVLACLILGPFTIILAVPVALLYLVYLAGNKVVSAIEALFKGPEY